MNTKNKIFKNIALVMAGAIFMTSCASTTMVHSLPTGAKVYIDGEPAGTTPYAHTDTKIVGSTTSVRLEKEGYETFVTNFSRNEEADVGAIIGGIFVLVPFLWVMKYKPYRTYELIPQLEKDEITYVDQEEPISTTKTKAEKLRELKQIHDEKLITSEEYEMERKKILAED